MGTIPYPDLSGERSIKSSDEKCTSTTSEGSDLGSFSDRFPHHLSTLSRTPSKPTPGKKSGRVGNNGEWPFERQELMRSMVSGEVSMTSPAIEASFLDWMESEDYNVFENKETGERTHAQVCKRGNVVYAARKTAKKNELKNAMEGKEFDIPAKGFKNRRWTKALLLTTNFDRKQYSMESSWYLLRSKPIEGCDDECNVINKLRSGLQRVFGDHVKLVAKEAQESGYPAPHIIILLEKPVLVELHNGKNGKSWRLCDPEILRRIGKDPQMRRLAFKDHRKAIRLNPLWKYGFIDIEGIVKGDKIKNRTDAMSYPFKYLVKCLTSDSSSEIEDLCTIKDAKDSTLKTALYTHHGNKCFNTRDITFGKGFKEKLELLPKVGEKDHIWKRIRTIPGYIHEDIMEHNEKLAIREFKSLMESPP